MNYRLARKKCKEFLVSMLVTCFFVGKMPYIPGTFGSICGVLIYFMLPYNYITPAILALFCAGVVTSSYYEKIVKKSDPKEVVIDEVVGQMITLRLCFCENEQSLYMYILPFLLFRFFDILKPWPIRVIDRNLHGGFGIMLDDVGASIFASILYMMFQFFHIL